MLTKIYLFFKIRRFYKIFGEVLGSNFINKLSDITEDNLYDVRFDINEVLTIVDDTYLNKLDTQIINYCERPRHYKVALIIILVALTLFGGYTIGRHSTIRQAELLDVTNTEYHIGFGDEIHTYTFEEVE